jgi:hypothetical protein
MGRRFMDNPSGCQHGEVNCTLCYFDRFKGSQAGPVFTGPASCFDAGCVILVDDPEPPVFHVFNEGDVIDAPVDDIVG